MKFLSIETQTHYLPSQYSPVTTSSHVDSPLLSPGTEASPIFPKRNWRRLIFFGVVVCAIAGIAIGLTLGLTGQETVDLALVNPSLRLQGSNSSISNALGYQFVCMQSCQDQGHSIFVTLNPGTVNGQPFNWVNCYAEQVTSCRWYNDGNCNGLTSPPNVKTGNFYLRSCPFGGTSGYVGSSGSLHWCNEGRAQLTFGKSLCGLKVVGPLGKTIATTTSITAVPTSTIPTTSNGQCGVKQGTKCGNGLCCSQYGWCGSTFDYCQACQQGYGVCTTSTQVVVPTSTPVKTGGGPGVIGYFPNWGPDFNAFDFTGVNVINYAFVSVDANGNLVSSDSISNTWGTIYKLNVLGKKRWPNLQTLVSVGGWTESRYFSVVVQDATRRARFVESCWQFVNSNGFDGVDLDWEFPGQVGNGNTWSSGDAGNFLQFLKELRLKFGSKLITIAASTMIEVYGNYLSDISKQLDWINVMTYDYCGPWCSQTGLNAPLFADPQAPGDQRGNGASQTMQRFVDAGVDKKKLTMGLAWYGRGFKAASGLNDGLYQPSQGADGMFAEVGWSQLRGQVLKNGPTLVENGWKRTVWSQTSCPTLFNSGTRTLISYDDPDSIRGKAAWVKNSGYGGVMVWSLDMDYGREMLSAVLGSWS